MLDVGLLFMGYYTPTIKMLLPSEIQDRKQKGSCFYCDEKFKPRHKCKRRFLLDTYSAKELESYVEELTEEAVE